jgi:hypothetical protein
MSMEIVKTALERAIEAWSRDGNAQPLTRWLDRELDDQGAPIHLPIVDWRGCLESVLSAKSTNGDWPSAWNERLEGLRNATEWFSRHDGTPVTHFTPPRANGRSNAMRSVSANSKKLVSADRAVSDGIPPKRRSRSNDEAFDWSASGRVYAVLRPGWPGSSDFLAVDHRDATSACRFELFGAGRSWLGPCWTIDAHSEIASNRKTRTSIANASAKLAEWSYRVGEASVWPTVLILPEHSLALLSVVIEKRIAATATASLRVSLAPGVASETIDGSRALLLRASGKSGSAQVLPVGLPALPYPTDRGAFGVADTELVLNQAASHRRVCLVLLVSWDAARHRREVNWRVLTVSEKSKKIAPDRAFAVRVSWGNDETYVIYRSLAQPAPRAFLGHQTKARFLVGSFNSDGIVKPIVKVD